MRVREVSARLLASIHGIVVWPCDRSLRALGALVFALWCGLAAAATSSKDNPTQYHVEILLFAVNDPAVVATEAWPDNFGISSTVTPIFVTFPTTAAPAPQPVAATAGKSAPKSKAAIPPYQFLSREDFKLNSSFFKLKKAPQYEVLLHTAWRQPAIDLKDDSAVYLFEGMDDPAQSQERIPVSNGPIATTSDLEGGSGEAVDPEAHAPHFSGTLKLALGQYLHVALDLLYRRQVNRHDAVNADGANVQQQRTALQGFRINEMRRIKLGEVNYFDHPVFGTLVLIAPVEKIKNADVEKETVGADSPAPAVMPDD